MDLHIARFGIYLNLRIFMYNICSNFPRISTLDSSFNVRLIARPHIDSNINVSKLSEKLIYFARFSRQNNRIVVLHNMLPPLNILTLIIGLPIHILYLPTRHYPSLKNDFSGRRPEVFPLHPKTFRLCLNLITNERGLGILTGVIKRIPRSLFYIR